MQIPADLQIWLNTDLLQTLTGADPASDAASDSEAQILPKFGQFVSQQLLAATGGMNK